MPIMKMITMRLPRYITKMTLFAMKLIQDQRKVKSDLSMVEMNLR